MSEKKQSPFGSLNDLDSLTDLQVQTAQMKRKVPTLSNDGRNAFTSLANDLSAPTDLQVQAALNKRQAASAAQPVRNESFSPLTTELITSPTSLQVEKATSSQNTQGTQPVENSGVSQNQQENTDEALPQEETETSENYRGLENILRSKAITSISEKLRAAASIDVLSGSSAVPKHSDEKSQGDLVESYKVTIDVNGQKVEIFTGGRSQGEIGVSQDANALGLGELANDQKVLIMVNNDGVTNGAFGQLASRLIGELAVTIGEQSKWDSMDQMAVSIQQGLSETSKNFSTQIEQFLTTGNQFTPGELKSILNGILAADKQLDYMDAQDVLKRFNYYKNIPIGRRVLNAIVSFSMINITLHNPVTRETHILKAGDTTAIFDGKSQGTSSGQAFGKEIALSHVKLESVGSGILHTDFVEKDMHAKEAEVFNNLAQGKTDMAPAAKSIIDSLSVNGSIGDDASFIMFQHI